MLLSATPLNNQSITEKLQISNRNVSRIKYLAINNSKNVYRECLKVQVPYDSGNYQTAPCRNNSHDDVIIVQAHYDVL